MPRFTNVGAPVQVYRPDPDDAGSLFVDTGQIIDVSGDLATEQPVDAYQVGTGDLARLWPRAQWQILEDKTVKPAAPARMEN